MKTVYVPFLGGDFIIMSDSLNINENTSSCQKLINYTVNRSKDRVYSRIVSDIDFRRQFGYGISVLNEKIASGSCYCSYNKTISTMSADEAERYLSSKEYKRVF